MNTILICDDDKDIVSALDIYLSSEGYRHPEGLRRAGVPPAGGEPIRWT